MVETVIFYVFATVLVGAALGVITSNNPVHSVLFLVLAFFNSAVLWILLEAEFLGIVLVLVYVGAVMVLFLFVVMMLDINVEKMREGFTRYWPIGATIALVMFAEMLYVLWARGQQTAAAAPPPREAGYSNTTELGTALYTDYAYPFELAAVILLLAIIAAIALTMRRRPGLKVQDISRQVATRREDRVRLVKVQAEKD